MCELKLISDKNKVGVSDYDAPMIIGNIIESKDDCVCTACASPEIYLISSDNQNKNEKASSYFD